MWPSSIKVSIIALSLGGLYTVYTYFYLRALSIVDAPIVLNMWLLVPFFSSLIGVAFFGEVIYPGMVVGGFLIIMGAILSSIKQDNQGNNGEYLSKIPIAIILMLISAILNSVDYSIQDYILNQIHPLTLFLWEQTGELMSGLLLLIFILAKNNIKRRPREIVIKKISFAFIAEFLSMAAALFLMCAYSFGSLSATTLILATQPTLTMFGIVAINKARKNKIIRDSSLSLLKLRTVSLLLSLIGISLLVYWK